MPASELPESANIAELAELFGVTTRQARNLLSAANVKSVQRGRWPLSAAVRGVLAKAHEAKDTNDLAKARTRSARATAEALERKNALEMRELIPKEDMLWEFDFVLAIVREHWQMLPRMLTRDRAEIPKLDAIIDQGLRRMAKAFDDAYEAASSGKLTDLDDD